MSKIDNFPYPTSILAKIWRRSVWSRLDPWCWGQPRLESQIHKTVIREIILEEFQRMWSQSTNVTDGRTTYHGNTELRRRAVKMQKSMFNYYTIPTPHQRRRIHGPWAIAPTAKKLWGRCPQVVLTGILLRHFWNSKMYINNMNLLLCQWQKLRKFLA